MPYRAIVRNDRAAIAAATPRPRTDFITPIVVLALLIVAARRPRPKSPESLALEAELEVAKRAMQSYRDALSKFVSE